MKIIVLGAGRMGRAITYDLSKYSSFDNIAIADRDRNSLQDSKKFLDNEEIEFCILDVEKKDDLKNFFKEYDIVISATPYKYNFYLAKIAIETKTHFLDLGSNDTILEKERNLHQNAKKKGVTIIPDCGLAPGLTSIITHDIVEQMDYVDYVKLRVGGLPANPKPPLNYQIVFSPYALIDGYINDAIVLNHGKIIKKKSMSEIEEIIFPKPFGKMEAFITSGGCSTLPYTYRHKIGYLDYKTVRYPGHCEKFKSLICPRNKKNLNEETMVNSILEYVSTEGKDVVLLKVFSKGTKYDKKIRFEYSIVDYYDEKHDITAMMRMTGFPASITAQMIQRGIINKYGVYCPEEIVQCKIFFEKLKKRNIKIQKDVLNDHN